MIYDYAFYYTPNRHFYPYIFLIKPSFTYIHYIKKDYSERPFLYSSIYYN